MEQKTSIVPSAATSQPNSQKSEEIRHVANHYH